MHRTDPNHIAEGKKEKRDKKKYREKVGRPPLKKAKPGGLIYRRVEKFVDGILDNPSLDWWKLYTDVSDLGQDQFGRAEFSVHPGESTHYDYVSGSRMGDDLKPLLVKAIFRDLQEFSV